MATVKTPRLNLAKQAGGDNPGTWQEDMNQGYDDCDARFFRSGATDPVAGVETADFIGQVYFDTVSKLWWTATATGSPGTWSKNFDIIDPLVTHPSPPTTLAEDYPHGHLNAVLEWLGTAEVRLLPVGGDTIYVDISGGRETKLTELKWDISLAAHREGAQTRDPSTPYYLYIDNLTTPSTLEPIISTTPPDDRGGTKPGYHPTLADHRCVGTTMTDPSSNLIPFDVYNGDVTFREITADHRLALSAVQALSWAAQAVNIPLTMTSVLIKSYLESNSGMTVVFGIDGLSFTFAANANDPFDAGMGDAIAIVDCEFGNAGTHTESEIARIPVINRAVPKYSFAVTDGGTLNHVVTYGYSDPWAPRGY